MATTMGLTTGIGIDDVVEKEEAMFDDCIDGGIVGGIDDGLNCGHIDAAL
jgi:hypothetical protein